MPSRKVLVVDDDADVVEYLSSFLEDNGYEVASANDSAAAREAVARLRPDGVLGKPVDRKTLLSVLKVLFEGSVPKG
jgi:DNA-binding NtrC family response regulator